MGHPSQAKSAADDKSERTEFEDAVLARLRAVFSANPWLVATEYVQGAARLAEMVGGLTDQPVLAVGACDGVGRVDESISSLCLDVPAAESMVATMRRGQEALAEPEPKHQAAVDRWDPDERARSIVSLTAVEGAAMGRQTFGARPQRWQVLEDKLAIEAVWAAAGVPVARSEQVDLADKAAVLVAHDRLASEAGTVWAGDNSSGWHGGGDGTLWAPDRAAAEHLAETIDRFERVRIMPFVEGIPCSMHGMVVPDGAGGTDVVTFRPCEMIVLRDRINHRFVYGRSATFWDPPTADRETMVDTALRIGHQLDLLVDYRGVFTVDGVVGADGFVPTEVNTRYGAALNSTHRTANGETIELLLLNLAVIEGRFDDIDLRPLGRHVTNGLDDRRGGRAFLNTPAAPDTERRAVIIRGDDGDLVVVESPDDKTSDEPDRDQTAAASAVATVELGSADGTTGFAIVGFDQVPIGPPTAPLLVEVVDALNRQWSLGISPLEPAVSVR